MPKLKLFADKDVYVPEMMQFFFGMTENQSLLFPQCFQKAIS